MQQRCHVVLDELGRAGARARVTLKEEVKKMRVRLRYCVDITDQIVQMF